MGGRDVRSVHFSIFIVPPLIIMLLYLLSGCAGIVGLLYSHDSLLRVLQLREPRNWIDLHTIFVLSNHTKRNEEYCVTFLRAVQNSDVRMIYAYTNAVLEAKKFLHGCGLSEGKVDIQFSTSLTYTLMLTAASSLASPSNLQVVLNGDIVLGDWSRLRNCLGGIHRDRAIFHLSRHEPEECFPLLDGHPRGKPVGWPGEICSSRNSAGSKDAVAFNVPINSSVLKLLNHAPNRLGAENLVSCRLVMAGFKLENPCELLPIYHNHCTEFRTYPQARIDAGKGIPKQCTMFNVYRSKSIGHGCL